MKYNKTIEIEAEQFLRSADTPPTKVRGVGKGAVDLAAGEFYVATIYGQQYLRDGDYIIYEGGEPQYVVIKEEFEKEYRKVN